MITVQDQAALVGDRLECSDTIRFFTGDHPAVQFEQGTKQGGNYKCGACDCKENLFDDQAHSLHHPWRPLEELQSLATNGTLGRKPGVLHPFDNLRVGEMRRVTEEPQ